MKRTFIYLTGLTLMIWGGSSLWLAGFEQGYEQGENSAWDRANATRKVLRQIRLDREPQLSLIQPETAEVRLHPEQIKISN